MKNLILVRHAKSSWDLPVEDHHRSLQENGIRRAELHAKLLKNHIDFTPEFWATSFATRALHTAVIFANQFQRLAELNINKNLYTFSPRGVLSEIANFSNGVDSAIIFGHNDAFHQTVNKLSGKHIAAFKTASVASITFDPNSWDNVANGKLNFIISKGEII